MGEVPFDLAHRGNRQSFVVDDKLGEITFPMDGIVSVLGEVGSPKHSSGLNRNDLRLIITKVLLQTIQQVSVHLKNTIQHVGVRPSIGPSRPRTRMEGKAILMPQEKSIVPRLLLNHHEDGAQIIDFVELQIIVRAVKTDQRLGVQTTANKGRLALRNGLLGIIALAGLVDKEGYLIAVDQCRTIDTIPIRIRSVQPKTQTGVVTRTEGRIGNQSLAGAD